MIYVNVYANNNSECRTNVDMVIFDVYWIRTKDVDELEKINIIIYQALTAMIINCTTIYHARNAYLSQVGQH